MGCMIFDYNNFTMKNRSLYMKNSIKGKQFNENRENHSKSQAMICKQMKLHHQQRNITKTSNNLSQKVKLKTDKQSIIALLKKQANYLSNQKFVRIKHNSQQQQIIYRPEYGRMSRGRDFMPLKNNAKLKKMKSFVGKRNQMIKNGLVLSTNALQEKQNLFKSIETNESKYQLRRQKGDFRAAKKFYYRPLSSSNRNKSCSQFEQIKVRRIPSIQSGVQLHQKQ